jgi:hypothetical protein
MNVFLIFTVLYGILPLALYYLTKVNRFDLKEIFPFLIVVFIASIYEFVGTYLLKIYYEKWYLTYKILAFLSINYFFYKLLKHRFKLVFLTFSICFILLLVFTITILNNVSHLEKSAYFNTLQTFIIIIFSILWFVQKFDEMEEENLLQNPNFYFVSGLIICYCGTLFLFLMSNHIYTTNKSVFPYYWLLNLILNLVLRTLLIVGVWKARLK